MKKLLAFSVLMVICIISIAQVPESISYQAIVRDGGEVLDNQLVSYQFSIIKGASLKDIVYTEKHSVTTNHFGLVNLAIGTGTDKTGDFSSIDWGADSYFLKVEIDPAGGTSYIDLGTTQLLSVPYALYAKTAGVARVNQIYFDVKRDAEYNWPTPGSTQRIDFSSNSSVRENQGNAFDKSISTFTAPEDGIYSFTGVILFQNLTAGYLIYAMLNVGGRSYESSMKYASGVSEMVETNLTIYLTAGQTAQLWGYVSYPSSPVVTVYGNSTSYGFTYFTGAKVR